MAQDCFHCGEIIPKGFSAEFTVANKSQAFCCYGCMAIAETIISGGLGNFYKHRTGLSNKALEMTEAQKNELALYDDVDMQISFVEEEDGNSLTSLNITGITCAACIWLLEREINRIEGVDSFSINHTTHKARLKWHQGQAPLSQILLKAQSLGYKARPFNETQAHKQALAEKRSAIFRIAIAGIATMQSMMFSLPVYLGFYSGIDAQYISLFRWVSLLMCTPVILYSAQPFFRASIRDIKSRHLTMDFPVSLAILSAYISSCYVTLSSTFGVFNRSADVYFDSVCMFTFFLLLGRFIEMQARHKHLNSDAELGQLIPATAMLKTDQGDISKPTHKLNIGDLIIVRQGEIAPADGLVVEGISRFDESALTGEFLPVSKMTHSHVSAGTINIENTMVVRVTALSNQSRISAILKMVDRAQSEKPETVRLADQVARYFVSAVIGISIVTAIYWWTNDPDRAFAIVLSVLVVTCPCALSLATPTALTAANTYLRSIGFLTIRSHVLEAMVRTTDLIFDKTGTLTEGKLNLRHCETYHGMSEQLALEISAGLEDHSTHPIAKVFQPFFRQSAKSVTTHLGEGLEGDYLGKHYRLGKLEFSTLSTQQSMEYDLQPEDSLVYLSSNKHLLARFSLSDTLRQNSKDCIQKFQSEDKRIHILSGDREASVKHTADLLAIKYFQSSQSPEQKLHYVQELQRNGKHVAMIGDGINDLPVLSGVQLSIAMGSASDLTKLNSDAVLLNDHLEIINTAFQKAKTTENIIKQNIAWAIAYNASMLPMAVMGWIPPYAAALGMSLSSLLVVFNSLRLKH